jgi:hypothetical protein
MKKWIIVCSLCLALLLSSCGKPEIQVLEVDTDTVSAQETIHMNNCGGKETSEQTSQRAFAIGLDLGSQIKADYGAVEAVVAGKYGQYRQAAKSQLLKAPAGTDMEFVLNWSEEVRNGTILVGGEAGKYNVHIPLAVELVSSRDLGCPTPIPTATNTPLPRVVKPGSETLTVYFKDGATGVSTVNDYSGMVTIYAEGTGKASAPQLSDAFYVFTDFNGNPIEPMRFKELYNFTLWINGGPADEYVEPIPPYNDDHVYEFTIDAPGGKLVFAVGDVAVADNDGYFTVTVSK